MVFVSGFVVCVFLGTPSLPSTWVHIVLRLVGVRKPHYGEESFSDGAIDGVRLFLCKAYEVEGIAKFWD
jgi:hypothetical protein